MNFYKTEEFLEEIISYIKFVFDRDEIRLELKDHMMDKMEYYIESGYGGEEAEKLTIKDMGDPREIGVELDKQHNPVIGWIWRITHIAVVLLMIINIFTVGTGSNDKFPRVTNIKGYDLEDNVIYEENY